MRMRSETAMRVREENNALRAGVRELFSALYDSTAQLVRAEQTRRLLAQLEEHGFNTLYG